MKKIILSLFVLSALYVKADSIENFKLALLKGDSKNYPKIEIRSEKGSTNVYMNNDWILDLRKNRRLRFRSTNQNDLWVGTKYRPMDLCWAYRDQGVNDYEAKKVEFKNLPAEGRFYIAVEADKPSVKGKVNVRVDAFWDSKVKKFHYLLSSNIKCKLENWYLNSKQAQKTYKRNVNGRPRIEGLDYHVAHVSGADIAESSTPNHHEVYNAFIYKNVGGEWTQLPKIYMPYPTRPAKYIAGQTYPIKQGSYYGFLDKKEGGWMTQMLESPSDFNYAPCWMFFDVHIFMVEAVPPRKSMENLDLSFKLHFMPVEPADARNLLANAKERPWRKLPQYQQPIFTMNNTFDTMITDGDNANKYFWWASSFDCFRDDKVGFDDKFSASIKHDTDRNSAWYARCWGKPYESEFIRGKYRIKAKVKTKDCKGKVRLAFAVPNRSDYWIHSRKYKFDPKDAEWTYSKALTGTNDWTDLEIIVDIRKYRKNIVLEQIGSGQSWFDNVVIEKIK